MDMASWLCVTAAAALFFTLLWRIKEDCGAGLWLSTCGALAAALLSFTAPPAVSCSVLIGFSIILMIWQTERRVELLQSRAVLITGCDSGFGHALAKRLSNAGLKVFAGVLDVNGSGAQQLREPGYGNLQVLQLDVTNSSQIEAAHRLICAQVAETGLWGLVNNAGVLLCPMDAELQPMTAYRRCMDVNFLSAVRMCQVFLPLLRRSKGRIVNMSSLAGEVAIPMFAAYGASKAALSVFSQVMRLELSMWGIKVALIQPTGFKTNLFGTSDDAARYRDEILSAVSPDARKVYGEAYILSLPGSLSKMSHQCAEDLSPVLDAMCHALLSVHPKPVYTPGQMARLFPLLHRCCPTAMFDAIMAFCFPKHTDCKPGAPSKS